jgi:general secretion pathway protein C
MGQYVSWVANTALFVLCTSLIADTGLALISTWLDPEPEVVASAPAAAAPPRTWEDRKVILDRNLFNSSILAPPAPPPVEEEELEATKLPLNLLGTVAAEDPQLARATVEDLEDHKTLVLAVNDSVKSARVQRIERRRVVLLENGKLRELALDEEDTGIQPQAARPSSMRSRLARNRARGASRRMATARNRTPAAERIRKLAENRFEVPRNEVEETVRNPAALFSQAQIQPKYDGEAMVGMQINAIKPGSLFEEIGIEDGDVITELNGIQINSPEESARILSEFSEAREFSVVVEGADGTRELNFTMPEE